MFGPFSRSDYRIPQIIGYCGLVLIIVGLSWSRFMVSLGSMVLALGFFGLLFSKQLRKPEISNVKSVLVFLVLFAVHLFWLVHPGDNFDHGLRDLKIKLPLLIFPILFLFWPPIKKDHARAFMELFVCSTVAASLVPIGYFLYVKFTGAEIPFRSFSPFISHIRLSLEMVLAFAMLACYPLFKFLGRYSGLLSLVLLGGLVALQSLTGLGILLLLCPWIAGVSGKPIIKKLSLGLFAVASLYLVGYCVFYFAGLEANPPKNEPLVTENGNYVFKEVDYPSLRKKWSEVSNATYDSTGQTGFYTEGALVRYLTSKGLSKDAAGISELSANDIAKIEAGHCNYLQEDWWPIRTRIEALRYQLEGAFSGDNPSSTSLGMRLVYWDIGLDLIRKNPWLGVGVQNLKSAYSASYLDYKHNIEPAFRHRAHNQWITFGICFGILGCGMCFLAVFIPFFRNFNRLQNKPIALIFLATASLSFFFEDTLESQMGATFFGFWYAWFCFYQIRATAKD